MKRRECWLKMSWQVLSGARLSATLGIYFRQNHGAEPGESDSAGPDLRSSSFLSGQIHVGIWSLGNYNLIRQTQESPNPRTVALEGQLGCFKEFKDKSKEEQQFSSFHRVMFQKFITCLKFNTSFQRNHITNGGWSLRSALKCWVNTWGGRNTIQPLWKQYCGNPRTQKKQWIVDS